jgi:hypothetical protein
MAGPASTSVISMKANPRDRPLSLSVIKFEIANRSERLEKRTDCLWRGNGIQVADEDVLHMISLF